MRYLQENDDLENSFLNKVRCCAYLNRHRKAVIIILISAILGIAAGLTLNYSLSLHNRNYIVRRKFETNQVFSYGRLLTNCFQMGSNTTNSTSGNNGTNSTDNKQCDLQKAQITFFVNNVTGDQSQIVVSVDDFQEFHSDTPYINGKPIQNLTWEDFKSNSSDALKPIPHLFYLTMNVGGEFISLAVDSKATKDQVDTVKTLLHQFTPNLNKQLYNSFKNNDLNHGKSAGDIYSGQARLLQTAPKSHRRMLLTEDHPQGYIQPNLAIVNDNSSQISISKSYDQSSFVNGTANMAQGSSLNYREVTDFDKSQGVLLTQVFSQDYKYQSQQNDLLNMNIKVESKGNFKLFNQSFMGGDQINTLIADKLSLYSYMYAQTNGEDSTIINTQSRRRVLQKGDGGMLAFDVNQYELHEKLIEQEAKTPKFNHKEFERVLIQFKKKHNLIDDTPFISNAQQNNLINRLYNQQRGLNLAPVHDEENFRQLDTEDLISQSSYVPKREAFGQPILIFLQREPQSIFGVTMDLFLVIQVYKDYYQDLSKINQTVTDFSLWKSFYSLEYKVQFKIRSDLYNKDMDLFTGGVKLNTTLLEKFRNFESYSEKLLDQLDNLSVKIDEFLEKTQNFFYELEVQKMQLFDSCYNLLVVDFCATCYLKFQIRFNLQNNLKDLIVNTKDALKTVLGQFANVKLNGTEKSILSLVPFDEPVKIDFSKIYKNFYNCKSFKKLQWEKYYPVLRTLYNCYNGYTDDEKDFSEGDIQNIKKNIDVAIKDFNTAIQAANNTFVAKFNQYLKNVDEIFRNNIMKDIVLNTSVSLSTRVDLIPQFSIKTKIVSSGVMLNGTMLSLNTTADMSMDLYNIAKNPANTLNLTRVRFDINARLFDYKTFLYYDYLDCSGAGKLLSEISNVITSTRLLEQEYTHMYGEQTTYELPSNGKTLQVIERSPGVRRNAQNIIDIGKDIWNFLKQLKIPDVKCAPVDQNMKRVTQEFKALQVTPKSFKANQTWANISQIIGKKYS